MRIKEITYKLLYFDRQLPLNLASRPCWRTKKKETHADFNLAILAIGKWGKSHVGSYPTAWEGLWAHDQILETTRTKLTHPPHHQGKNPNKNIDPVHRMCFWMEILSRTLFKSQPFTRTDKAIIYRVELSCLAHGWPLVIQQICCFCIVKKKPI